ncbi:MAG: ROK family glucokinase [Candidatus Gastranaerophilales bacterium]|nr:ROK family glucokinase [Candidatus Gastranaerophilales bacterium]
MKQYAFGVDIGGTTVKMGLFDKDGILLDKWEIPTVTDNAGAAILPDVTASIEKRLKEKEITKDDVAGVGVGAPGAIDREGRLVRGAVNIGWGSLHLAKTMSEYLGLPVKVANDANVAALGEMWQGGGKGYSNLVAVTLGTGVGGGIIVDGQILAGTTGAGGEIGHIHIEDNEKEACNCGNRGCLEQYASATGIARLIRRRLERDDKESVLRQSRISPKTLFVALREGDPVAKEIAEQFGEYLGKGLAIVASVVNPEIFVIGGGVSKAGEILLEYIEPAFQKYAFEPCRGAKFALASLGNDAGIYGAAGLIWNSAS